MISFNVKNSVLLFMYRMS